MFTLFYRCIIAILPHKVRFLIEIVDGIYLGVHSNSGINSCFSDSVHLLRDTFPNLRPSGKQKRVVRWKSGSQEC